VTDDGNATDGDDADGNETDGGNQTDGNETDGDEDDSTEPAGREYYEFDEPQEADLVQLQNGETQLIDERELSVGTYRFLQLNVSNVDGTLAEGGEAEVDRPGNAPLTFNAEFDVRENTRTVFTADFAPVRRGNGRYLLRPVPRGSRSTTKRRTATEATIAATRRSSRRRVAPPVPVEAAVRLWSTAVRLQFDRGFGVRAGSSPGIRGPGECTLASVSCRRHTTRSIVPPRFNSAGRSGFVRRNGVKRRLPRRSRSRGRRRDLFINVRYNGPASSSVPRPAIATSTVGSIEAVPPFVRESVDGDTDRDADDRPRGVPRAPYRKVATGAGSRTRRRRARRRPRDRQQTGRGDGPNAAGGVGQPLARAAEPVGDLRAIAGPNAPGASEPVRWKRGRDHRGDADRNPGPPVPETGDDGE